MNETAADDDDVNPSDSEMDLNDMRSNTLPNISEVIPDDDFEAIEVTTLSWCQSPDQIPQISNHDQNISTLMNTTFFDSNDARDNETSTGEFDMNVESDLPDSKNASSEIDTMEEESNAAADVTNVEHVVTIGNDNQSESISEAVELIEYSEISDCDTDDILLATSPSKVIMEAEKDLLRAMQPLQESLEEERSKFEALEKAFAEVKGTNESLKSKVEELKEEKRKMMKDLNKMRNEQHKLIEETKKKRWCFKCYTELSHKHPISFGLCKSCFDEKHW